LRADLRDPFSQLQDRHEVYDTVGWNFRDQRSREPKLNEFQLPRMMRVCA